ncbi:hypothetical protein GWI33_007545 [Rhynchophorus ferrugineus]|uniref:Uncharacterized protein n=1 Tax=Rhynchophorus ferrugineus TaxID=354439 RepID=A0A834MBY7_RHYFE|nr:hypothetical protein GWI33_007545 [Rhynchophorus ferrugineus]
MDLSTVSPFNVSEEIQYEFYHNFSFGCFVFLSLLSLVMFIADIYLMIIINKFKSLQTYQNLLILKTIWFHLGYIIFGEILFLVVTILSNDVSSEGNCFLENLDSLCLSMVYFLMTFLAADWFISQYHPNFHQKHLVLFTKRGLYVCFVMALPETVVTSAYCFISARSIDLVAFIFKVVSFILCFSVVTVMFIVKRRRPLLMDARKYEYCFTISFVFLLMSLPITFFGDYYHTIEDMFYRTILMVMCNIGYGLYALAPIVTVFLLAKHNKHFKVAYMRCCKRKSAEAYADDINDVETVDEDQDVAVSFGRHSNSVQLHP